MKIVHVAPSAPYNDNWGYQDNLLPKYHKKMGHDVSMITTTMMHGDNGIIEIKECDYYLDDGVHVFRKKQKQYGIRMITGLNARLEIYDLLKELRPDFVFFHGLVSTTIFDVIAYKKKDNPDCIIVQDNHLDYNIGIKTDSLKGRIIREYHRFINRKSSPYVEKVYGVTPWRKQYTENYFKIPASKTDILIMGADDEKIDLQNRLHYREIIRRAYSVQEDEFLIVTGGKIDENKKIDLLMEACRDFEGVRLLVFGSVQEELKKRFYNLLDQSKNITYVGWIQSDLVYQYFFAADLVFFPGQHSVLWEQACASKVPCVFEKWEGMDHVNNGGNSDFLSPVTISSIQAKIKELLFTEKYMQMLSIAQSEATNVYCYSAIARKSLECINL